MAAALEEPLVRVAPTAASPEGWIKASEDIEFKVLSVDQARYSVEFLFRTKAGYNSGKHKHLCETHVYILEGRVRNETIGCEFGPGDYCYQPANDEHVELFLEDTTGYGSWRGDQDLMVEFYDDDGNVCGEFKVSDYLACLG
ncbi:MAG: hypothetical protein AAF384_12665 [Pseudomonadota bacterium]